MNRRCSSLVAIFSAVTVAGCSSGDSGPTTGPLTVRVIDAPIDPELIDRVCISFTGITVNYAGNEDVHLAYDPLPSQVSSETHCTSGWNGDPPVPPVRLDALSGALTVALVDSLQVPVGRITWIRLHFDDGSYLVDNVGEHPLACPSCEVTDNNQGRGFKLNRTFEVTAGGLGVLVDIDLLTSLHQNATGYVLRPTARIEPDDSLGTIAGLVDPDLVDDLGGTAYTGSDVDTGCAVYVFPDDGTALDDYHTSDSNVVSTARVRYNGEAPPFHYGYAAGALPGGEAASPEFYRAALTCDDDDPLTDDDGSVVEFTGEQTVEVLAGETTQTDF
jgi:hypothetical protein